LALFARLRLFDCEKVVRLDARVALVVDRADAQIAPELPAHDPDPLGLGVLGLDLGQEVSERLTEPSVGGT
jgi:hypothetical protein